MKTALVTGAAGFIGLYLTRALLERGYKVVGVENFIRGPRDEELSALLKHPNFTLIEADLTDPASWNALTGTYEEVYHLAAINGTKNFYEMPHETLRINVLTVIYALEWMRTHNPKGKILFTSSNEAYAGGLESFGQLPLPTPEDVPLVISDPKNPRWSYAGSKLIGEQFFIHYGIAHGIRQVIVRPHNFYGPRAGRNHVIPEFVARIVKEFDPFPIFGANNTRTFCYIDDAVSAMQMIMESPVTDGKTYHIGAEPESEISMHDLAKTLFEIAGWHPKEVDIRNAPEGSTLRRAADITRLKTELGWTPKVDLKTGLLKTYQSYRALYLREME